VEMWMDKCDAVEIECVKYTMALGGNVKVTGSSVGELRNEQVLPKRYAMVSKYQEKLRQVSGIALLGGIVFTLLYSYITPSSNN
jgi:Ase1/PRC1/MAP65 family protein